MAGALQPLDHTDPGPHGYWIVELRKEIANAAFYPIHGCEYVPLELELDESVTGRRLLQMAQERIRELEPYQLAKLILTGTYDPQLPPDEEALMEIERVAAVKMQCRPDYNFDKLKREYQNQMVGRYIRALEALPQDEITRRALYLGIDALMGNTDVY